MTTKYQVVGGWREPDELGNCVKCGKSNIVCPKEGHFNSDFWELVKDDGLVLYVCPSGCPEPNDDED